MFKNLTKAVNFQKIDHAGNNVFILGVVSNPRHCILWRYKNPHENNKCIGYCASAIEIPLGFIFPMSNRIQRLGFDIHT